MARSPEPDVFLPAPYRMVRLLKAWAVSIACVMTHERAARDRLQPLLAGGESIDSRATASCIARRDITLSVAPHSYVHPFRVPTLERCVSL